jgi:hypothetical protein
MAVAELQSGEDLPSPYTLQGPVWSVERGASHEWTEPSRTSITSAVGRERTAPGDADRRDGP